LNTKIALISATEFDIVPLNENALLLSYGNIIDDAVNKKIIALHHQLTTIKFPGFIESVPAYASIAVFYDTVFIKTNAGNFATAFEFAEQQVLQAMAGINQSIIKEAAAAIIIPVYYNGTDLEYIARIHQLTVEEVIQMHTAVTYRVFMTGFLPGFAYMGTVDERIATPRKETPRLQVAAGSVGIAGAQTGIYPMESPGGWQLIGITPIKIFDAMKADPCLLKAGDTVQFIAVDKNEFKKLHVH
jgi:inhibitor of KinA